MQQKCQVTVEKSWTCRQETSFSGGAVMGNQVASMTTWCDSERFREGIPVALQQAAHTLCSSEFDVFPIQMNRFNSERNKVHHRRAFTLGLRSPIFWLWLAHRFATVCCHSSDLSHWTHARLRHFRSALFAPDALIHVTDDGVCSLLGMPP